MTKKPLSKMTLTIDDQKWIKLLFDRQDEVHEKLLADAFDLRDKELTKALAEVIEQQNKFLFDAIEKQNKLITGVQVSLAEITMRLDSIEKRLDDGDIRFALLERYASLPHTILRSVVAIAIGLATGWILHSLI